MTDEKQGARVSARFLTFIPITIAHASIVHGKQCPCLLRIGTWLILPTTREREREWERESENEKERMRDWGCVSGCGAIGEIIAPANTIATTTRTREALSSDANIARDQLTYSLLPTGPNRGENEQSVAALLSFSILLRVSARNEAIKMSVENSKSEDDTVRPKKKNVLV